MTGAAPAESRSKRVVVESEMVVAEVLEAAGKAAPSQDAFLDGLRKQLVANIRLLRDDEIPEGKMCTSVAAGFDASTVLNCALDRC